MTRKIAFLFLLAGLALPAWALKPVTVEQLGQVLAAAQGKQDADVARELADLALTERLNSVRLSRWRAGLPGEKSQTALLALADTAAFLDPPKDEIPAKPAPDFAAQRQIMTLTVNYVKKALPLLPNMFATRDTTSFVGKPQIYEAQDSVSIPYEPLRLAGRSRATVLYRDGRESLELEAAKAKRQRPLNQGLTTWGSFGPILSTVLLDAAQNKLEWSRWEQGPAGPEAVFRYSVPQDKSHYDVRYCCFTESYGFEISVFHQLTGYHGEITIDPDNGSILRLTLQAELKPSDPLSRADLLVEYAPVEIGGETYICPVRGVALSLARVAQKVQDLPPNLLPAGAAGALTRSQASQVPAATVLAGPRQTLLNDVAFEQYHMFRSDSRLMTEDNTAGSEPAATTATADSGFVATGEENSAAPATGENPTAAAAAPAVAAASTPAEPPAPKPVASEITVSEATGVPEIPAIPHPAGADTGFTLHTTSRLVDVGVVAFDKKGHPVTDLKPGDFEIYDNGRKQEVRYFAQASTAAPEQPAAATAPGGSMGAQLQPAYFNRRGSAADGKTPPATESNVTILLLDGSNLSFGDLTYARGEALRFLKALPAGERVGLYALKSMGFDILADETTDHEMLEAKLTKWMPTAQDMSNAQDEEARNRQQMETVHSIEDLLYVNGNNSNDPSAHTQALDPKLRDFGNNPARNAFAAMVGVARHLAALPGHKSLVWVTSDNVLADWSNNSITIGKSSKFIEGFALRAQEAMNDAHVSVYPLDASQLEAAGADASIGRRNVELNETAPHDPRISGATTGPEMNSGQDVNPLDQQRDMRPGRITAQMQQDLHPIQGAVREVAEATGGRVFRRSGGIAEELNGVVNDGRAAYLLSFTPDVPADGQYHLLTVKLAGRRNITLRYRTGYEYNQEPATLKDRFREAVWQPVDMSEIAISANPAVAGKSDLLKLNIAATDLELAQVGILWTDKLDIFLVERDDAALHAQVTGHTLGLQLKPATYQKFMSEGIPFDQPVHLKPDTGSVRLVVVDENSGRMGSVTVPAAALRAK
jgi:VWFA-related protein